MLASSLCATGSLDGAFADSGGTLVWAVVVGGAFFVLRDGAEAEVMRDVAEVEVLLDGAEAEVEELIFNYF